MVPAGDANRVELVLREIAELRLHLVHFAHDVVAHAEGAWRVESGIVVCRERAKEVAIGLDRDRLAERDRLKADFRRRARVKALQEVRKSAGRAAAFRIDADQVARSAAQVEELHQARAVVAMRVRQRDDADPVDPAVEHRRDAVARVEQDAVRVVQNPCREQGRREKRYPRKVQGVLGWGSCGRCSWRWVSGAPRS